MLNQEQQRSQGALQHTQHVHFQLPYRRCLHLGDGPDTGGGGGGGGLTPGRSRPKEFPPVFQFKTKKFCLRNHLPM